MTFSGIRMTRRVKRVKRKKYDLRYTSFINALYKANPFTVSRYFWLFGYLFGCG